MQLAGARALVTGATGGIGRAIAHSLHARGAHVLASGRRADVLDELCSELGERAEALPSDLAQPAAAAELAARAGTVDLLVANAALPGSGRLDDFEPAEIDRVIDVNLRAPMLLTRALVPGMLERRRGHIVLVSSVSGKVASPRSSVYSATKFGLRGFADGLREDLRGTGVGLTVVVPGFISDAGMFADTGVKLPPFVRLRAPDEVGAAVVDGVEHERPEVSVAPLSLRIGTRLGMLAPLTAARIQRRLGSERIADALAEAQRAKR